MKGEATMENKNKIYKTINTKKFTILHSNDMHGDFLAEVQGEKGELIGGLAYYPAISIKYGKKKKMFCM